MADIEASLVDVVVIYKIDRLTRSLTDFSKMVEVFERHGVSFVPVTQQFNTTTSMGRLMLNILLSFAQFEREVTGERIRDKIAASKRKGMWMGGIPPLGYDVENRRLVPDVVSASDGRLTLSVPIQIKRRGGRKVVRLPGGNTLKPRPVNDKPTPIQMALARGHRWLAMLESGEAESLTEVVEREGMDRAYVSRMVNLTTLAPDIVAAILDETLPSDVTLFDLASAAAMG